MTGEILKKKAENSPLVGKYAKRIGMLQEARKVSGAKELSAYGEYYAARLFENINRGNLYEGYTQGNTIAGSNYKRDAFNITAIAIQNSVLPEIVSNQAMSSAAELLPILQLKYGTDKGSTKAGDIAIDSTGAGKTDPLYDSGKVEGQIIPSGTTTYIIPFTPIVAGTINLDGATEASQSGSVATLTDGTTVDLSNGVVTFASATSADKPLSFEYDNSIVPNYLYPELDGHNQQQVGDVVLAIDPVLVEGKEHK